jgi:hypothetical protein
MPTPGTVRDSPTCTVLTTDFHAQPTSVKAQHIAQARQRFKSSSLRSGNRFALGIGVAAALLSACGASQPPIGAPGAMPQSLGTSTHLMRRPSWMAPDATRKNLLYISDVGTNDVYVYESLSLKLAGTLTGFSEPQGECSDAAGNVWITNTNMSQIIEYAHGGTTPIATLSDPYEFPVGCAVDPRSGNLAVHEPLPRLKLWIRSRQLGDLLRCDGHPQVLL